MLNDDPNRDAIKGHCSDGYTHIKQENFKAILYGIFSNNHFYNYIDLTAGRGYYDKIMGSPLIAMEMLGESKLKDKNRFLLFEYDQSEHLTLGDNIKKFNKWDRIEDCVQLRYNNEDILRTGINSNKWEFYNFLLSKRFSAETIVYTDIKTMPPADLFLNINDFLKHPDKGQLPAHYIIHCVTGKRGQGLYECKEKWDNFFKKLNGAFANNMFITEKTYTTCEWSFIVITENQWIQKYLLKNEDIKFVKFTPKVITNIFTKGVCCDSI